jgi:hypothetical protein
MGAGRLHVGEPREKPAWAGELLAIGMPDRIDMKRRQHDIAISASDRRSSLDSARARTLAGREQATPFARRAFAGRQMLSRVLRRRYRQASSRRS